MNKIKLERKIVKSYKKNFLVYTGRIKATINGKYLWQQSTKIDRIKREDVLIDLQFLEDDILRKNNFILTND